MIYRTQKVWNQLVTCPYWKDSSRLSFYSIGVQTVMLIAIDFGIKELKLEDTRYHIAAVIQLVAIVGAIGMSRLSERFGNIKVPILQ